MRIAPLLALLAAAPALAQGLPPAWSVDAPKDAPATLLYGPPASPQIGFACERGTGQVTVRLLAARRLADRKIGEAWVDAAGVAAPWPASVAFASGDTASTLRGHAEPLEPSGGTAVTTEISTQAPVIKAFGKTGVITVTALGGTVAPEAAKPGMVRKFLGACR
jgi:hypothetical protein